MLSTAIDAYLPLLAIFIAFVIAIYAVKKIIFIAQKRKIYDIPDNIRKIHGEQIPSLGGIGLFVGYCCTIIFFNKIHWVGFNAFMVSSLLLFFTGIYDDIMNMEPYKKLLTQLGATFITVYYAQLDQFLWPLMGQSWPALACYWLFLTLLGTFYINVFNFIDGIDGLAGMLSILYSIVLGIFFFQLNAQQEVIICCALIGGTAGLLWYNYAPAKIYMGDTGSMFIGFTIVYLCLKYLQYNTQSTGQQTSTGIATSIVAVLSLVLPPMLDAMRVFVLRMSKGISPLKADRLHLHYYLIDAGLGHAAAAWALVLVHVVTLGLGYWLANMSVYIAGVAILLPTMLLTYMATLAKNKQRKLVS